MVLFCAVIGCSNKGGRGDGISFFRLPAVVKNQGEKTHELSEKRRHTWISALRRADLSDLNLANIRICSCHFVNGKPSPLYSDTDPDWTPTLHLGYAKTTSPAPDRYIRLQKRKDKVRDHSAALALLDLQRIDETQQELTGENEDEGIYVQTETSSEMIEKMKAELETLSKENSELKEQLISSKLTVEMFKNDDGKVRFFTGLPGFVVLSLLISYIEPYLDHTWKNALDKFQQIMLVLMRLRLNLSVQFLGYYFGVSHSTASRYFLQVLNVMYVRLLPLIHWPSREDLQKTMPMEFRKHFGLKVAVIVDCFEIFIERPSNLMARAQTWSNYKHHNTVKFLIGITPQGVISYISPGYGGRASDKYITGDCGILDKLLPGDVVLADRGFDISADVALMFAEVKIPAFTRGKTQLSPFDVEQTRNIAHVRIHVERVIGNLRKKYSILQDTMPLDFLQSVDQQLPTVDKIISVCSALTNLCDSVVPFS